MRTEISAIIANLPLARQINIARKYPRFGTVANAVRVTDKTPKRRVMQ